MIYKVLMVKGLTDKKLFRLLLNSLLLFIQISLCSDVTTQGSLLDHINQDNIHLTLNLSFFVSS